jgi:hypothetical protein
VVTSWARVEKRRSNVEEKVVELARLCRNAWQDAARIEAKCEGAIEHYRSDLRLCDAALDKCRAALTECCVEIKECRAVFKQLQC